MMRFVYCIFQALPPLFTRSETAYPITISWCGFVPRPEGRAHATMRPTRFWSSASRRRSFLASVRATPSASTLGVLARFCAGACSSAAAPPALCSLRRLRWTLAWPPRDAAVTALERGRPSGVWPATSCQPACTRESLTSMLTSDAMPSDGAGWSWPP